MLHACSGKLSQDHSCKTCGPLIRGGKRDSLLETRHTVGRIASAHQLRGTWHGFHDTLLVEKCNQQHFTCARSRAMIRRESGTVEMEDAAQAVTEVGGVDDRRGDEVQPTWEAGDRYMCR